jgi:hypothetical protein
VHETRWQVPRGRGTGWDSLASGVLFLANKRFSCNPLARPLQMPPGSAFENLFSTRGKIIFVI